MEQRLEAAARAGNIDALYSLMKEDAYLLERIEEVPFIDTPLHVAASAGQVHFAMEIMRLKPSFARKLNQNGYSPIHLALQSEQTKLVLHLLDVDKDLVRVQGREGKTALHFAAECGMIDLLAEFLSVCPKSIQDLTIQKETALHVAVKSDKVEALKVLLGWLEHVGKDGVLEWCDDEGNTILHVAASRNQIEMVSLIITRTEVNAKNTAGLTALDISDQIQPNSCKLRHMLLRGGGLKASSLPVVPKLADSLKSKMSWREKWIVSDYRKRLYLSNEDRNIILLVAVLFATANYQAALDSPDGSDDEKYGPYSTSAYGPYSTSAYGPSSPYSTSAYGPSSPYSTSAYGPSSPYSTSAYGPSSPYSTSAYGPSSPYSTSAYGPYSTGAYGPYSTSAYHYASYNSIEYYIRIIFKLVNNIAFFASMVEIYLHLPADCGILRLVLPLVICNYAVISFAQESYVLMLCLAFLMVLFYHSKLAIILHKYVPIFVQKKVVKMKIAIFNRCSSFHRELVV